MASEQQRFRGQVRSKHERDKIEDKVILMIVVARSAVSSEAKRCTQGSHSRGTVMVALQSLCWVVLGLWEPQTSVLHSSVAGGSPSQR